MHRTKTALIFLALILILSCNKNTHEHTELNSNLNKETGDNQANKILSSEKKFEEIQNQIISEEFIDSNELKEAEKHCDFKKYDRNLWNSDIDDELFEVNFSGCLYMFDLSISDTEDVAYDKLIKNYESIKKDGSFEGIDWYSDKGMNNGNTVNDFELAYYGGNFLSFFKDNLSEKQLQDICNMFNIECKISELDDAEFYKVKSGKWHIYFSHHYGDKYEYYVKDSSINF